MGTLVGARRRQQGPPSQSDTALSGTSISGTPGTVAGMEAQGIVTPEMCVAGRDLTEARLSPDGRWLACVTSEAGVTAIRVLPLTGGPERTVTGLVQPAAGRGFGGGCYTWLGSTGIAYIGRDGALHRVPVTAAGRPLTRLMAPATHHETGLSSPDATAEGDLIVVCLGDAEIWLVHSDASGPPLRIDTGEDDFVADPRVTRRVDMPGQVEIVWQAWNVPDMPWDHSVARWVTLAETPVGLAVNARRTLAGAGALVQPQILPDGRLLCGRDDHGWMNLWLDDAPLVDEHYEHAGPTWGAGLRSMVWSPDGTAVAFTRNEEGFGRLCVAEVASGRVHEIARGVHGSLEWQGEHLAALRSGARTPTQIITHRLGTGESIAAVATDVTVARTVHWVGPSTQWDTVALGEPELLSIEHDGARLYARVYRPANGTARDALIVWVHGGPTDQWQVTFMPRVAWLTGLGWEVLVVDPRGTTGHGRAFQQALHGQWGDSDVADTAALITAHQHATGIPPQRTVIAGSSSGGLSALATLARFPDRVAGGVAISPVCDLVDLAARSHRFEAHYTVHLVGDPQDPTGAARGARLSPVTYAAQIRGPLLMIHGALDPVVPADHSRILAERIIAAGGQVDLHIFEGEGHGLRQIPHRLTEYRLIEEFLAGVLRSSPAAG